MGKFFDLLTHAVEAYHLTPDKIFNVDETGITIVPKRMPRINGTKWKKHVGLLTSAKRGQLITVVLQQMNLICHLYFYFRAKK